MSTPIACAPAARSLRTFAPSPQPMSTTVRPWSGTASASASKSFMGSQRTLRRVQPLADVRILAIEQFGAGPWGTLQLSDLGAEVIKIEDPGSGGDVARTVPPFRDGEDSLYFEAFNRGKRSISLDLRTEAGRAVFEDLVREVDAVFSNLRGDQPAKLRITYEDLRAVNPRIVCCSLCGFGMTGPRAAEPAYDHVLQAMTGWMALTGEPDGPPTKSGLSLVDYSGGYVAALGVAGGRLAGAP